MSNHDNDNIVYERMFVMEEKFRLFDIVEQNFPIWDIIRNDIFLIYSDIELKVPLKTRFSLLKMIKGVFFVLKALFDIFFIKKDNLLISNNRYRDSDGKLFDKASQNIVDYFEYDLINIDNVKPLERYRNRVELSLLPLYKKFCRKRLSISDVNYSKISYAVEQTFSDVRFDRVFIDNILNDFYTSYKYYLFMLNHRHIRRIFFVQNGVQKGLVAAAKKLGTETYELQHGSVSKVNFLYSYINGIDRYSNIIFPDYFLSWGAMAVSADINMPATVVPLGNDFYVPKISVKITQKSHVLIISTGYHSVYLKPVTRRLSILCPDLTFVYKLHPQEYFDVASYKSYFSGYDNVEVKCGETDLYDLIGSASAVFLIYSTVAYETLNVGKKLMIYKRSDSYKIEDLSGYPNVYFVDTEEQFTYALSLPLIHSDIKLFENFNAVTFSDLLCRQRIRC